MEKEKYFVIYSRKSRFTGRGESIENQVELCRQYICRNFGSSAAEQVRIYEDEICIEVREGSQAAVFDGDMIFELKRGDQVVITKSDRVTRLIRLKQVSFLENLSNKLAGI